MFSFGNHFDLMPRGFNTQYKCYSVSMLPGDEREDVEKGGKSYWLNVPKSLKNFIANDAEYTMISIIEEISNHLIIMPPSALDVLTRLNIVYPMLFKVTNNKKARTTHCGVLEFVADEGHCYLPHWMMKNLLLEEGDLGQLESTSLPVATFAKFQPQSVDFLDITDPKAVLENALRLFACLTKDDVVAIKYNERIYELLVLELRPGGAVSIIECDMQVDFATPVGYVEPERKSATELRESEESHTLPEDILRSMVAKPSFPGPGNRLDGKKKKVKDGNDGISVDPSLIKRGIPDLNYKRGKITFMRKVRRPVAEKKTETPFSPFAGEGQSLR